MVGLNFKPVTKRLFIGHDDFTLTLLTTFILILDLL